MKVSAKTRMTSKGQVTVPKTVRDRLGLRPGDQIEFVESALGFRVVKVISDSPFEKWSGFLEDLRGQTQTSSSRTCADDDHGGRYERPA